MENKKYLKRNIMIVFVLALVIVFGTCTFGTSESIDIELNEERVDFVETVPEEIPSVPNEPAIHQTVKEDRLEKEEVELNDASEAIIGSSDRKATRIAELSDKYNDPLMGRVAYYFELAQKYSFPICFIGIAMGAFNFLIIGNKKLDKKEQGFNWIVGFTIGLVVFNVMPLLLALIAAGR